MCHCDSAGGEIRLAESDHEWDDERVLRSQTHPGVGLLTSLALVYGLEPVTRFARGRKVAAYVGLDPME